MKCDKGKKGRLLGFEFVSLWLCRLICVDCLCADRPVTYLYNTLHYYERHLRDRTNLKRKLVHAIMSSLKVCRYH